MSTPHGPQMPIGRMRHIVTVLVCLNSVACFRSLDLSKVKCLDESQCPGGYSCSRLPGEPHGTCTPNALDGSRAEQPVSPEADSGLGLDGIDSASVGTPDGLRDVAIDGAGGTTGGGGTTGATGGTGSPDAPIGTGGTTASPDGPVAPADAGLDKGAPCTSNAQCASTHCIDGVCCATICSGCNACASTMTGEADGTCAPAAAGSDPHETCTDETATKPCGNDGTCDGKGACRMVASGQRCGAASCSADGSTFTPESTCDGAGTCAAGTPVACAPYQCAVTGCVKTCSKQTDCDTGSYCNTASGTCAALKSNGTPATQSYECSSGIVADGVCCNDACTAACKACTSALNGQPSTTTGTCLPVTAAKATAAHSGCAAGADPCGADGTCDGVGNCRYPATGSDCGPQSCNLGTSMLTKGTCSASHTCTTGAPAACPGSAACLADGSGCKPPTCSTNADCASGYACASGTCTQKLSPGAACTSATAGQCSSGSCVDGHCCTVPSCGTCQACTGTGGTCVAITNAEDADSCSGTSSCDATGACKKKAGQSCGVGTECLSTYCADTVCCDRACNGSCEYCNNSGSAGTCGYVSGTPRSGHAACSGSGSCQGYCNASKATCTMPGAETSCRAASCSGGTQTNPANCDGSGTCPASSTTPCSPYICGSTSCLTSCTSASQCSSATLACLNNQCQSCPAGRSPCNTACYDLQNDDAHCGSCTYSCPGGTPYCTGATCVQCRTVGDCQSGYLNCTSNKCVCAIKSASNVLAAPGFDGAASLGSWTGNATYAAADADNCPGSGSVLLANYGVYLQQCLAIGGGVTYNFGVRYKGRVNCGVTYHGVAGCADPDPSQGPTESDSTGTSIWTPSGHYGAKTPVWAVSLLVKCDTIMGDGNVDQVYVNTGTGYF